MSKVIWIDRDECWTWYDSKPTADVLGLKKGSRQVEMTLTDEEYVEYNRVMAEFYKWNTKLREYYEIHKFV